jgi:predicted DNA-binding transcriptional regulator YafY
MPIDRSSRLEDLNAALRATDETTIAQLAEELGVSQRTIRRDIATLRLRGMDIDGDRGRGGGVRLSRAAPLPPVQLSGREAIGIWLSVQITQAAGGLPYSASTQTGLNKLISVLPPSRRAGLRRLADRIVVGPAASPERIDSLGKTSGALLPTFEQCFNDGLCLGFRYRDARGKTTQRRVEPHGMYVASPIWYVIAIDIQIDELRMFRMDRISNPRQLRRSFAPSRAVFESALPN